MDSKVCTECGTNKPLCEFSFKSKIKGLLHSDCKECHRKKAHKHYSQDKAYYLDKASRYRVRGIERNKAIRDKFLDGKSCEVCGGNDRKLVTVLPLSYNGVRISDLIEDQASVEQLNKALEDRAVYVNHVSQGFNANMRVIWQAH